MQSRVIIMLLFAIIVAVFAVMNIQPVVIDYLFGKAEIQLIFVIIFSIFIGALFMFILSSMKQIQLTRKLKSIEKENTKLKAEVEEFENRLADNSSNKDESSIEKTENINDKQEQGTLENENSTTNSDQ